MTNPLDVRRTVGVVGMYYSGKTVLLTSLIAHLRHHDPRRLPLDRDRKARITFLNELDPATGLPQFPFAQWHTALRDRHCWPRPTIRAEEYRARYAVDAWRSRLDLSLVDLPGDRLADMAMAPLGRFADWSDSVVKLLEADPEFSVLARPYLNHFNGHPAGNEQDVVGRYKRLLAMLTADYVPLISPSTFLALHPDGEHLDERVGDIKGLKKDQLVQKRATLGVCGLSESEQFAPLPAAARTASPTMTKLFERRYQQYRQTVVKPFADVLRRCDDVVVAVDVTVLLEGGHVMFNAYASFLEELVRALDPGLTTGGRVVDGLVRLGSLGLAKYRHVRRLILVATKADRVLPEDRDRLDGLLRDLTEPVLRRFQVQRWLQVETCVVAAVHCTEPGERPETLRYLRDDRQVERPVSRVPEEWPEESKPGEFRFPRPQPSLPPNRFALPRHVNLDRLVRLILS